jgi:hypothetical protein
LIFFPSAVFNIDKFLMVGVASVLIRACNHTLKLIELQFLTNGTLWGWYCKTIGTRFLTFKTCFSYNGNECTWVQNPHRRVHDSGYHVQLQHGCDYNTPSISQCMLVQLAGIRSTVLLLKIRPF